MLGNITEKEYRKVLEARAYVDALIKRAEKRLNKYQDEHEQGFEDYSGKISKIEHELELLELLKEPQQYIISEYTAEQRESADLDELSRLQWERDNGEAD